MKRWNNKVNKKVENKTIDMFLDDIRAICKKHKLSLSHEDEHGSFEVVQYSEQNIEWLLNADDATF
ncbi:unnamed protein product [marine sediment metagenome]|uniref:Uncharacterized protein n=1 Tax=marine sediment metagenome TaxID=412755 RepID=X0X1K8_9ZZZZ